MSSCAARWEAIRTDCTNAVTTNTVWPGPCECGYYANDLPCFDEQVACAAQVWTQVPQWFRDGVTSCIMKDAGYTIRAQLGSVSNPFLSSGLAGVLASSSGGSVEVESTKTSGGTGSLSSATLTSAQTGGSISTPTASPTGTPDPTPTPDNSPSPPKASSSGGLSTGAKAGIGVGVALIMILLAVVAFFLVRRRRRSTGIKKGAEQEQVVSELHGQDAKIYEAGSKNVYPDNELAGSPGDPGLGYNQRYELESPPVVVELGHGR
ncbi:hypothetical protein K505DRAFT_327660 [Melanomma pulvis-pyrius CBS 109.77]|uniref:Extracellular membrane protein CFEM domain-containing protein n=1 Tax=Melanomma pulvis-pyrius CBS 109.77 TaxID=1314802 RepID=A0A6A6X1U9_9PLEO|nr:hypothetical protein K505DRAFT_327660 [Melanomma pulvis-pyrius CBS 109.77]